MSEVAVIIPVFNRQQLLKRAVNSVQKQTFKDFECIVVDDGSDTPLHYTIENDSRFKWLRLSVHSGVSKARNAGVSATSAPVITFLDSDDEWRPEKLERQLTYMRHNPQYRIIQTQEIWMRKGIRINPPMTHIKKSGTIFAASLQRCMITPSSVCMYRTLFNEYNGFNESLPACEDFDLWLRITARYPIGLIDDTLLIRYGGREDQLSASIPILDRFRVRSMLQLLYHGNINDHQRFLLQNQVVYKATILSNGYKKRGNYDASEKYRRIASLEGL